MKAWQIVCILCLLVIMAFNPKIQVFKIFHEQLRIYKNDRTQKISLYDIVTFLLCPIILSILISLSLAYDSVLNSSDTIITVFSIVATLLLSFLALLVDKSTNNDKEKMLVKQTFVTITIDIMYSIFVVGIFAIPHFLELNEILQKIFVGLVAFLIIKIILNVFMILKRVFVVLNINSDDGNAN